MTVKELIKQLQALPDHEVLLLVDCPHCGHANELRELKQVVVVRTKRVEQSRKE